MNSDNKKNVYNQEIKPIHRVLGIGLLVYIAATFVLLTVSWIAGNPGLDHLVYKLMWIGGGAGFILSAYSIRLIHRKFAILSMILGVGMIILAFTHFLYLLILVVIGVIYVSIVYYRRVIKPILTEKETENL
jgi:hypothetical protein